MRVPTTVYFIKVRDTNKVKIEKEPLLIRVYEDMVILGGLARNWARRAAESIDGLREILELEGVHPSMVNLIIDEVKQHTPVHQLEFNGVFYPREKREEGR